MPGVTFAGNLKGNDLTWSGEYSLNGTVITITNGTATFSADLKSLAGTFDFTHSGADCSGAGTDAYSYTTP